MTPIGKAEPGVAATSLGATAEAKDAQSASSKPRDAGADIKQAAAAFEAILVRQMLASSSVAGKGSYSDMGVEALSTAVTAGGGLGLGLAIERAIGQAHHAAPEQSDATKKKTTIP